MGTPRIAVSICRHITTPVMSRASGPLTTNQTDIRIGTRTDKTIISGGNNAKVARVESILDKKS